MKINIGSGLVTLSAVFLAVTAASVTTAPAEIPALDSCTSITPRALDAYSKKIGNALKWASADASKNGRTGAYAVAATNSKNLLQRALDRSKKASADLRSADASVTTAAEAGTVKEHVRYILEIVPQAAHWAIISEIYHKSQDARKAFDASIVVLDEGNRLYAESGRCYMDGL